MELIKQRDRAAKNAPPPSIPTREEKTQVVLQAWHFSRNMEQPVRGMPTQGPKSRAQHLHDMQRKSEAHPGLLRYRYAVRELRDQLDAGPEVYGLDAEVENLAPIQSRNLERPFTPEFQMPDEFTEDGRWEDLHKDDASGPYEEMHGCINPAVLTLEKSSSPDNKRPSESMDVDDDDSMDINANPTFCRPWEAPLRPLPPSSYAKSSSHMIGPYPAHASKPLWPNGHNIQRSFLQKPAGMGLQRQPPFPPSASSAQQQQNPLHPPAFYQQPLPNQQHLAPYQPHLQDKPKTPGKPRGPYRKKQKLDSGSSSGKPTHKRVTSKDGLVSLAASPLVQPSELVSLGSSRDASEVFDEQRRREGLVQLQNQARQQASLAPQIQMREVSLSTSQQAREVQEAQIRAGMLGLQNRMQVPVQRQAQSPLQGQGQAQPFRQGQAQSPLQSQAQSLLRGQAQSPQAQHYLQGQTHPILQTQAQASPHSHMHPHPTPQLRRPSISTTGPPTTMSRDGDAHIAERNSELPPYPYPTPASTFNEETHLPPPPVTPFRPAAGNQAKSSGSSQAP
jgi:hypothetical protein